MSTNYNHKFVSEKFILGLFFLIYGTFAYVVGGDYFKYLCILLGVTLIIISSNFFKLFSVNFYFFIASFLYFLVLIFLSFYLNQKTSLVTNIIFQIICFLLFCSGFFISKLNIQVSKISNYSKFFISSFLLIGSIKLFYIQNVFESIAWSSRNFDDDYLNGIGVAYICVVSIFLLFWLLLNEKNKFLRIFITLPILTLILNLIYTESRAPILLFTLIMIFQFKKSKLISFGRILIIILVFLICYIAFSKIPSFEVKIEFLTDRFLAIFGDKQISYDNSANERLGYYSFLLDNYQNMIFGQFNYEPYPHNQFIEIYMRWGLLGFPIFVISILTFLKTTRLFIFNNYNFRSILFLMIFLFMYTYLQSLTSFNLDNNRLLWLGFGFFLGIPNKTIK